MAQTSGKKSLIPKSGDILFVHCNMCFKLLENDGKFYLLSCSDITCFHCLKKAGRIPFCTKCQKQVAYKTINQEMESKYLKLFTPEINSDGHHNYCLYAEEFQYLHTMELCKQILKVEKILEENQKNKQKLIELNERYKELRQYRKKKQSELKEMFILSKQNKMTPSTGITKNSGAFSSRYSSLGDSINRSTFSQISSLNNTKTTLTDSTSMPQKESANQFFQNRIPLKKVSDLSEVKFTHFKPMDKSTPMSDQFNFVKLF